MCAFDMHLKFNKRELSLITKVCSSSLVNKWTDKMIRHVTFGQIY